MATPIERLKTELPPLIDSVPNLKKKTADEYAGPCPKCGGEDRFIVWKSDRFWCRQCGWQGDIVDYYAFVDGTDLKGLLQKQQSGKLKKKEGHSKDERQRHKEAQQRAEQIWQDSKPADPSHPYLIKKKIKVHGIRQTTDGRLIIPAYGADGTIQTLQFIAANGEKRFLAGAKKAGACFCIKGSDRYFICEGYATGAAIHKATGCTVIVAFDAGNILPVAETIRAARPDLHLTICADDDRHTAGNPGLTKARAAAEKIRKASVVSPQFKDSSSGTDFNDLAIAEGIEAVERQLTQPESMETISKTTVEPDQKEKPEEQGDSPAFKLIHVGDLQVKPQFFLIDGLLEADSLTLIFGDPGTFKSFLAIFWACCVATGKEFLGRPVKQGPVIYIAGEGQNGLARRFQAWALHNNVNLKETPIYVSIMPAGLCDFEETKFVSDAIDQVAKEYGTPVLIVVDTLARNFGPGDESTTKDMSGFIRSCDTLRGKFQATLLLIHHSGHSDKSRARGAMALKGALDAEYRLDRDELGVVRFETTKMKDAAYPEPMAFRPEVVDLGIFDEHGVPVTSVVLEETSYVPPAKTGKEGRGKWQTLGLEILENLQDENEQRLSEKGFDTSSARVSLDDWRHACFDNGFPNRTAFKRVKDTLSKNESIVVEHGFVSLV